MRMVEIATTEKVSLNRPSKEKIARKAREERASYRRFPIIS